MHNIHDLNFNKEILKLFDFTQNALSREALVQWFSEIPDSIEEITARQDILRTFLRNKQLYDSFSYSTVEFNEVYAYFQEFKQRDPKVYGRSSSFHLFFAKRERQQERGRLSQMLLFFNKISGFYFSSLDVSAFPPAFKARLQNIMQFFKSLHVEEYEPIIRTRGLSIHQIVSLNEEIREKIKRDELRQFWEDLFLFEACLSISKGIRKNNFVFPHFADRVSFTDFYHPLIQHPVKNSLVMKEQVIVVTGPNMSGKSTLLKAVGLCVFLGHLGLPVPAASCELMYFDSISVCIHLRDDLSKGYSHFMTEIKSLKNILTEANGKRNCFAIFDELFRGTNEEDAFAISRTTILGLAKYAHSFFLISTHLHQLKEVVAESHQRIGTYFMDCDVQQQKPVFTFRLQPGWSDLKIGQILFRQEGIDKLLGN